MAITEISTLKIEEIKSKFPIGNWIVDDFSEIVTVIGYRKKENAIVTSNFSKCCFSYFPIQVKQENGIIDNDWLQNFFDSKNK